MMSHLMSSLQSLGVWGYWVVGLMAFLEALVLTSIFAPGTVVVVLGGALAAQGIYDWGDMIAFVAVGTFLGAELSYRIGRRGESLFQEGRRVLSPENLARGQRFFARYGALSLLIGHFFGPLRPVAPVIAGVSLMPGRAFLFWNAVGSLAYAAAFVAIGFFFGTTFHLLTPATTRVGLFLLLVAATLVLLWLLALRIRRGLPYARALLRAVWDTVRDEPQVRAWAERHPRLVRALAARVSRDSFMGLPATVLGAAFVYFLVLYAGLTEDVLTGDPIVALDQRLASLLFASRDPGLVRVFTAVTTLGHWKVVLILAVAASALLWLGKRPHPIAGLWLALVGNQLTVTLLKHIFARPRSDLAVYAESSLSFPSGHAAVSAAFYGMLVYLLMRERVGPPLLTFMGGVTLVFLIGLSRLYLGEHYLSDVLNGYVVGALWALMGIFLAEWLGSGRAGAGRPDVRAAARAAGLGVLLVASVSLVVVVRDYRQTLNQRAALSVTELSGSIEDAFARGQLPSWSESILGTPVAPVGLVLLAADDATLRAAFEHAGWTTAEPDGFGRLLGATVTAWLRQPDPEAPVVPSFWNGQPNDMAFMRGAATAGDRWEIRVWRTALTDPEGDSIFVAVPTLERGLGWSLERRTYPDVAAARDQVVADLEQAQAAAVRSSIDLELATGSDLQAPPTLVTDGRAVVLKVEADRGKSGVPATSSP